MKDSISAIGSHTAPMNQAHAPANPARSHGTPPATNMDDSVQHDSRQQADEVILSHFSDFSGNHNDTGSITQADFNSVAHDPNASGADRAAAQYYLGNPQQLSQLEQNEDPSQGSINQNAVKYANEQDAARNISANFRQLDTAGQGGSPDGLISQQDLKAALKNQNLDPNLRSSINFLEANPDNFDDIDAASQNTTEDTEPDGLISQKDLSTVQDPDRQLTDLTGSQFTYNPNGN